MRTFGFGYLIGYAAVLTTVLGALAMVMLAHLTGATWFVVLRRQAEAIAGTLPWLALLFLPILLMARDLYPWAVPEQLSPEHQAFVARRSPVLTLPFFAVRSAVYLGAWVLLGEALLRTSRRQDRDGDPALTRRLVRISAVGLPVYALTLTFAAFDWLMTLSLPWHSTIYGLYVFGGSFVAGLALIAVQAARGARAGRPLERMAGAAHFHALGKLLLTAVLLWAYLGYAQLLIGWIGNLPREVSWYLPRIRGNWSGLGLLLLFGHFVLPFAVLLSRAVKRRRTALLALGIWLLLMHYLDTLWLVGPEHRQPSGAGWFYPLLAILLAGSTALAGRWRQTRPAYPTGDPGLAFSVGYETPPGQ